MSFLLYLLVPNFINMEQLCLLVNKTNSVSLTINILKIQMRKFSGFSRESRENKVDHLLCSYHVLQVRLNEDYLYFKNVLTGLFDFLPALG